LPWLNVLSADPSKVDRSSLAERDEAMEAKLNAVTHDMVEMKRVVKRLTAALGDEWKRKQQE